MENNQDNRDRQNEGGKEPQPVRATNEDVTRKVVFSLCYVFGILFFLPLILYKDDAEARRHANQGLVLLLFSIIGNVLFGILTVIPVIGFIFGIVSGIYSLLLLILGIVGIVNVCTEKEQDLPVIGGIKIIK